MPRRFAVRLLAVLTFSAAIAAAHAQPPAGSKGAQASEAEMLLEAWQKATDIEQKIAIGEQIIAAARKPDGPVQASLPGVHFALGVAYFARAKDERADNIERSIGHLEAAAGSYSREAAPADWARARNNLAIAYTSRIRGDRSDNLERALASLEAAEPVLTREAFPQEWGQLQNNFSVVYFSRIQGDRSQNLEAAIRYSDTALTAVSKERDPYGWGMIQHNLAAAYTQRKAGSRIENQRAAIAHMQAAHSVFTRETHPSEWAQTEHNLGIAYFGRAEGDRADNQEQALYHFQQALGVFSRESTPKEWAQLQYNLGIAYAERLKEGRAKNRRKAIAAFDAALGVFTRDAYPLDHLRVSRRLATVLLEEGELEKAAKFQEDARQAFLLLLGQGQDETEARALITEAGPLFAEAAYTAAARGDGEQALLLANEGRGRLLAIALRRQSSDLTPAERDRLAKLRGDIRAAEHTAEAARAEEKAEALTSLAGLRTEVLTIMQRGHDADSPLKQARSMASRGTVVVMPIVTSHGGKLLIAAADKSQSASRLRISIIDAPQLTTQRLSKVLVGDAGRDVPGGWLGGYFVNYLDASAGDRDRWPEWIAEIGSIGSELWPLLGAPLTEELRRRGIAKGTRLVWLPSGWLGTLPLSLAHDPADKHALIDDYEIVYAPNLQALAASDAAIAAAGAPSLAAVVNPTGDLPGTEKEGAIVASYFAPSSRLILQGSDATPSKVLAALKGRSHWHFASHGSFAWQNARRSGLHLAGPAMLTVGDLLEADSLGHPRLVVLSACETGLYDITSSPDEFIGLPGTFTALGAAGVLGTLWPVSDAATALLIGKFYELHAGSGVAPPAALRQAQLWLRGATADDLGLFAKVAASRGRLAGEQLTAIENELAGKSERRTRALTAPSATGSASTEDVHPYAHPYFWAGFIYTGL